MSAKNILFLCVANSARSQMAEGIARNLFGDKAVIESAGSIPKGVHTLAIESMKEIGIDISKQYSKNTDKLPLRFIVKIDYMISLCEEDTCPDMASRTAQKLKWAINDPAVDNEIQCFRIARDQIKKLIEEFGKKEGLL
jgi:arsenate reductase